MEIFGTSWCDQHVVWHWTVRGALFRIVYKLQLLLTEPNWMFQACRHEFHRRLKVYHAWKAKNRKRTTMEENERAPKSVMEAAAKAPPRIQPKQEISSSIHRYFRIPFMRANNNNTDPSMTNRIAFFAHFFNFPIFCRQTRIVVCSLWRSICGPANGTACR